MAVIKGSQGKVKVGGTTTVAEVKSYSLEETSDTVEKTAMGDSSRSFVPTLTSVSATLDVNFDDTDSGQSALSVGATVTVEVFPEGDATGDTYYQFQGIVTSFSRTGAFDGLVEASISVQGTGGLTTLTA